LLFLHGCAQKTAPVVKEKKPSEYEILKKQMEKDFENFLKLARCIQKRCKGWLEVKIE